MKQFINVKNVIENVFSSKLQTYQLGGSNKDTGSLNKTTPMGKNTTSIAALIITTILYLFIMLYFGQFLWNNVLRKCFGPNIVAEMKNPWHIIGLAILFNMIQA